MTSRQSTERIQIDGKRKCIFENRESRFINTANEMLAVQLWRTHIVFVEQITCESTSVSHISLFDWQSRKYSVMYSTGLQNEILSMVQTQDRILFAERMEAAIALKCIHMNGTGCWEKRFSYETASVMVTDGNRLYVHLGGTYLQRGLLLCLSLEGTILWQKIAPSSLSVELSLHKNRLIYGSERKKAVYVVDANTSESVWSISFTSVAGKAASPVFNDSDDMYIIGDGILYCISSAGAILWKTPRKTRCVTGAALDNQGNIYLCTHDLELISYSAKGQFNWSTPLCGFSSIPPICDKDNCIYVASESGGYYQAFTHLQRFTSEGIEQSMVRFQGNFGSIITMGDNTYVFVTDQIKDKEAKESMELMDETIQTKIRLVKFH